MGYTVALVLIFFLVCFFLGRYIQCVRSIDLCDSGPFCLIDASQNFETAVLCFVYIFVTPQSDTRIDVS